VTLKRLATAFRVFAFPPTLGIGGANYESTLAWQGKNGSFSEDLLNEVMREGIDGAAQQGQVSVMQASVNFKIGNEKLVKVMEGASTHLRGLLDRQGRPDGALRIAVIGGGCSGLQYKMDLVDGPRDRDILIPSNGVNVVIDPKSALFVSGSELDFSDDLQQGGFKVSNPNAIVTCSCGESFAA
jgi:iron-sulfur cluster assembly accessory protein